MPPSPLFPSLMDAADWQALAPAVRRMHGGHGRITARGMAQVEGATHARARWLRRLLGLPAPGREQAIELSIERSGTREIWTRRFASARMRSTLDASPDGATLHERLGPIRFEFRLLRLGDAIDWQLRRACLAGLPLPRRLMGSVLSRSGAEHGRYAFQVDARPPGFGQLIAYRGWLEIVDED
jgi:hypothetical protein